MFTPSMDAFAAFVKRWILSYNTTLSHIMPSGAWEYRHAWPCIIIGSVVVAKVTMMENAFLSHSSGGLRLTGEK
jgi:hypothetical protein